MTGPITITHEGCASLRLEMPNQVIRFDPCHPPSASDLTLLTWNEVERLEGTIAAVEAGQRPQVVAAEPILTWLGSFGPVRACPPPVSVNGMGIEARAYRPVPYATPIEGWRKLRSALADPVRAMGRLRQRMGLPVAPPSVFQIVFPGGGRLLHLNCALHSWTSPHWLEAAARELGGADWMIVGMDFEQGPAVVERLGAFRPGIVLLADLVFDVRRKLELPDEPLEPWVEALREQGIDARGLVAGQTCELGERAGRGYGG